MTETSPAARTSARPLTAAFSLCRRECLRFFRQRNRVIGAIGQPILFWLLFGAGMNRMFQVQDQSFSEYYFPGTMVLILLFTAIFATISIIEDRREGFLQSVLVAPSPRWSMVLGKVLGGSIIALVQAMVFLLLSFTLGIRFGLGTGVAIVGWLFLSAIGLTAMGFVLAWRMESTQGFHAIMNLLLMPMWLLSGAFFPIPTLSADATIVETGMHWMMRCNPVTYVVSGLRRLLYADMPDAMASLGESQVWVPSMMMCWIVVIGFAAFMYVWASRMASRHTAGDLL